MPSSGVNRLDRVKAQELEERGLIKRDEQWKTRSEHLKDYAEKPDQGMIIKPPKGGKIRRNKNPGKFPWEMENLRKRPKSI